MLQIASKLGLNNWTDWLGVGASVACAIHCAAMPFVAVFLPMLGLSFLMDDSFHQVMVVVCSTIAISAFIPGFRRHRSLVPICVGVVGLSLISTAAFAMEDHCCASCAATESLVASADADGAPPACTESCCNPAATATQPAESPKLGAVSGEPLIVEVTSTTTDSFLGSLTPWITSLGGLLLIGAHLTNRQFSCRCGCCPSETNVDSIATIN
jgi:hypothetical protein